jgi:RsiW-degrading membrane proteinase PrsW (M82 family)
VTTSPSGAHQQVLGRVGLAVWALGCLLGSALLVLMFVLGPLVTSPAPGRAILAGLVALAFALPACAVYVWVPVLLDRYDPEPWWALAMTFLWGALAAAGLAAFANSILGAAGGAVGGELGAALIGSVVSAPLVEEAAKGSAVLGLFWFLRREFDGPVDGVIYAIYAGLGFAMTENVVYYARGLVSSEDGAFVTQVVFRGLLEPWAHPLYTALFGLGVGVARESPPGARRIVAPLLGYLGAVSLHAVWNLTALVSQSLGVPLVLPLLALYMLVLLLFLVIVVALVAREGRILREQLQEHVRLGHVTAEQYALIVSPVGRLSALLSLGRDGRRLVQVGARLAMAKWHVERAARNNEQTQSVVSVLPLAQELERLSHALQPRAAR